MGLEALWLLLIWIISIIACGAVGDRRGLRVLSYFLGLFMGPLGLLILCLWPLSPEAEAHRQLTIERAKEKLSKRV